MKIVIDIKDDDYYDIIGDALIGEFTTREVINAVKDGTPLPKGHGDLIDRKDLIENGISKGFCDWYDEIKMADTIIEADKAESEDNKDIPIEYFESGGI